MATTQTSHSGAATPRPVNQAPFSGWWRRVGAALIDGAIVAVPLIAVAVALGLGAFESGILVAYGAPLITTLVYSPLLMARGGWCNGQTWGKQVTGIRVVRDDGEAMDLSRGLVRDLVGKGVLGFVPLYTVVDVLLPLFADRKQAVHDRIGSTTVRRAG